MASWQYRLDQESFRQYWNPLQCEKLAHGMEEADHSLLFQDIANVTDLQDFRHCLLTAWCHCLMAETESKNKLLRNLQTTFVILMTFESLLAQLNGFHSSRQVY